MSIDLKPVAAAPEPSYPDYGRGRISQRNWKRIAAALGASAALWLPACGIMDCGRTAGEPPAAQHTGTEQPRMPGAAPVLAPDATPTPQEATPPTLPEQPEATATPDASVTPTATPPTATPDDGRALTNLRHRTPGGPTGSAHPREQHQTPATSPIKATRPGTGLPPAARENLGRLSGGLTNPAHPGNEEPATNTPTAPPVLPEKS